jgi:hypothetical protein
MMPADQLAALERMGVPHDKAQAAVQAQVARAAVSRPVSRANGQNQGMAEQTLGSPHAGPFHGVSRPTGIRPISEAEEQRRIRRTALERGALKVYWMSQARKTQQTPGVPDLWIAFPTFGMWWEVKAVDGRLSPFQEDFRDECLRNGTAWGTGTHADFCGWLDGREVTP